MVQRRCEVLSGRFMGTSYTGRVRLSFSAESEPNSQAGPVGPRLVK